MSDDDVLTARKKLCFKLAEALDPGDEPYDVDLAYRLLCMWLPNTYAEAEAEMDDLHKRGPQRALGPSKFARIKELVNADKGTPVGVILDAVIKKLEACQ